MKLILIPFILTCPSFMLADTAILVALPSEQDALRKEIRLVGQPIDIAGHRIALGYRNGEKLYVGKTGAGNLNSAMVTEGLIAKYRVDRVISIGVAGSLSEGRSQNSELRSQTSGQPATPTENRELRTENFHIGDVLIVTNVVSHQVGKETPGGFETGEKPEGRMKNEEGYRQKCEELRSNAVAMAKLATDAHGSNTNATTEVAANGGKLEARPTIREGRLVSGDSFIASSAKRKWLRETFDADAVDMVSAGIARVCEANGVPYVILRVLSDNADEFASADFAAFVQKYKEPVTAEIAVRMVDKIVAQQKGADAMERAPPKPQ